MAEDGSILVLDPIVPTVRVGGHAHPCVRVVILTVENPAFATLLLRTEHVLVAALGLGERIFGALGPARATLIHIHLVLNVPLQTKHNQAVTIIYLLFLTDEKYAACDLFV